MHELGISRNIVAIVSDAAGGRRVRKITLELGHFSGVEHDAILFCFDVAAAGTAVEGARLEIRTIGGRARCADCGAEFNTESLFDACACGSRRLRLVAGEELNVKSFEIEEAA